MIIRTLKLFLTAAFFLTVPNLSFAQTLSSVQQLRIFHNPAVVASPFGLAGADAIGGLENSSAGTLVIDNVAFVPEPSSASLILGAAGFLMARRRRCV